MNTASQHKEEIIKNSSFPALGSKLGVQIRGVIVDKIYTFQDRKEWFCRYSLVLLQEMDGFHLIITKISKNERLQTQYAKELVFYYGLVIGVYRFLEGVSWGYSSLLTHNELDRDNMTGLKVLFNFMIRLKRFFLFKKADDFEDCKTNSNITNFDNVNNEVDFLSSIDHDDMENLVKGNVTPTLEYLDRYEYIEILDDSTILQEEKQILTDFISQVKMEEISVKSIEKLSKKRTKREKAEAITMITEESKDDDRPKEHEYVLLDTSNNILGIKGGERVSKILANHISQYTLQNYGSHKDFVSIIHYCLPQNKMTYDSYYIVKNIIYSILNKCPEILSFFKLLDLDINIDIFYNDSETLRKNYTEIFIRFMKKLKELKLDYNIVIFISQADCAYVRNHLSNFFFLLRQSINYFPPYIKFIMTFTGESIIELDEISRILILNGSMSEENKNDLQFLSKTLFDKYANAGFDIVGVPNCTTREELLAKCENDFEKILDFVELKTLGVEEELILNKYDINLATYVSGIDNSNKDPTKYINIIRILSHLKIPVSIETLASFGDMDESTLLATIKTDLKSIVWLFNKRSGIVENQTEEDKFNDFLNNDERTYAVIQSINYFEYENPVEVHNEIVRILRKNKSISHYALFCAFYHISEGDDDYTKDFLNEDENKLEKQTISSKDDILADNPEDKMSDTTFFDLYSRLFKSRIIYEFIKYHRGFEFLISEIGYIIGSHQTDIIEKERSQLLNFRNMLYLIEHTMKDENLSYPDFCSQLRGRLIGEEEKSLMYKLRIDITNEHQTYFKGFQNSLRENAKIETILKFPFSVNKTGMFADQRRIAVFGDSGLIYICGIDFDVISVISNEFPSIEGCQYFGNKYYTQPLTNEGEQEEELEEEFLFTGGDDPYIRKWDINSQREVASYKCHKTNCTSLIIWNEFFLSTGDDKRLVLFNIEKEKIVNVYKKDGIKGIRVLDNVEDKEATKILISTIDGFLELLDLDLGLISSLSVSNPNEVIVSLINHSLSEFLSFTKDGQITVYDQDTLNVIKEESILNLKSDDYLDLILIRSKEYILFTLEKQKMDFYTGAAFKKTDSWDYFFDYDLHFCDHNYEGSKIIIGDRGGYVTLFNFLRNADPNSKGMQLSGNRRNDPVSCLEVTHGLDQDKIISCSNDRDLRIWKKEDGVFIKKYDLSSFTTDPITSMRLGKDQNMLFLGSKDMNVYLIDVGRGKLGVVYEGHWNKVNLIYTIPERDILITVSESNIKVWDLEYDECIKNMNDHESNIIHVSQYEQKSQQHILTIGSNFEMRMWNYETGEDSKAHKLNILKQSDSTGTCKSIDKENKLKTVVGACTFGQQLYLATNKGVILYSLIENDIVFEFKPYNNEQVIDIFGYKTKEYQYLVITTRTSGVLYKVFLDTSPAHIEKICGYYINAKRLETSSKHSSKFNNNFRFYFTSARISELRAISKTEVKKMVAGTTFTGLLDNTEGVSFENHEVYDLNDKSKDDEYKPDQPLTTRVIDTNRERIRQEVLLVCLGDSKGYLHFNHLYIE